MRISGKVHILDSWESFENDQFRIIVDGEEVYTRVFDHTGNPRIKNQCPGSGNDNINYGDELNVEFSVEIPHTATSEYNVWFTTTLNSDSTNESWGLSDVRIELFQDPTPMQTTIKLTDKKEWSESYFSQKSLVNTNWD